MIRMEINWMVNIPKLKICDKNSNKLEKYSPSIESFGNNKKKFHEIYKKIFNWRGWRWIIVNYKLKEL